MYCEICQVSRYVVVVVVVEIFVHGAVKATVTNAPQSQLNK